LDREEVHKFTIANAAKDLRCSATQQGLVDDGPAAKQYWQAEASGHGVDFVPLDHG
jgi:hypothetical protein